MARGGLRQAARKGRPARGAVITFRLSKRATVQITAARVLRGRMVRAGKRVRCRPVAAKVVVPKGRRCTAVRTLGTIRRNGSAGRNRFVMTGRVGARVLPAGTYRLTFRATDADGQRSPVVRRTITILPVPRQPPRRSKASG